MKAEEMLIRFISFLVTGLLQGISSTYVIHSCYEFCQVIIQRNPLETPLYNIQRWRPFLDMTYPHKPPTVRPPPIDLTHEITGNEKTIMSKTLAALILILKYMYVQ